jgi:hypothetical protein
MGMNPIDTNSAASTPGDGWDYFDRIYCISLEEREDRRKAATVHFSKVGLEGKVEFVIVKRHPVDVEQGIYEAHMTCLQKGLQAGAKRIIVFEDDVLFCRFNQDRFRHCTRFLADHPDWKVLLLGALIRASQKTGEPAVQKAQYQSLAHAYALNRPYAETLAYKPWEGLVFDTLFRRLTGHIYAVNPMFAFQSDLSTDNKYPGLYRFRRWCGGLKRIQEANEFYQQHKFGIIATHVLLLVALVLFLIRN